MVPMQFTHNHPTGRLINSQGFYLGSYPIRVYHYSFTRRYLPYQGLPLRVCRGGGGVCGVRDFVVPPTHKKSQPRITYKND